MIQQLFLVCDSSTLANFKSWAQSISTWFSTAGWLQSSDTGQVNWSTISAVPGSGAYVYEVWEPNDGLTNFFLKVEYGNSSGTNSPGLRLTISTSTNGAGTATGFIVGPYQTTTNAITVPSSSTTYECDFSGAPGRIGIMMWRNAPQGSIYPQQFFGVERSVNSGGSYTGAHVTLVVVGVENLNSGSSCLQQALLLGVGAAPVSGNTANRNTGAGGLVVRLANRGLAATTAFNGSIGFDTASPYVGYFDYPLTQFGAIYSGDIAGGYVHGNSLREHQGIYALFCWGFRERLFWYCSDQCSVYEV